jgi:hypothetical protein
MTSYRIFTLTALWLMLISFPSQAETHQHGSRHAETATSQEAHIHGIAKLFLVLEDNQLNIEFLSPAMNLLGFEHQPNTPEQKTREQNALKTLAKTDELFLLEPAVCQMTKVQVGIDGLDTSTHHNAKDKSHNHSGHENHYNGDSHRDMEAHYHYHCEQAYGLHSMTTNITNYFPGIQSLQVQWIVNGRQGAITLDNSHHHIIFR